MTASCSHSRTAADCPDEDRYGQQLLPARSGHLLCIAHIEGAYADRLPLPSASDGHSRALPLMV